MSEPAELWQARAGDVITLPGCFAGPMTVLSLTWDDADGDYLCLTWTSPRGQGTQHLPSLARIGLASRRATTGDDDAMAGLRAALEGTVKA